MFSFYFENLCNQCENLNKLNNPTKQTSQTTKLQPAFYLIIIQKTSNDLIIYCSVSDELIESEMRSNLEMFSTYLCK